MNTQPINHRDSHARTITLYILIFLLITACSTFTTTSPPSFKEAVSGKVDVGGYQLYYSCAGEGSPTVILEAGGPSESSVWDLVRVYMGVSPRVCAYDRANLGKSDSAPKPRTFSDMTRDLHTLLQNVPIEGPYVLVGHSMGGMLVQLYASQYPEDVVGLVLVDSGHPDMGDRLLALLPPETANEDKSFKEWRQWDLHRRHITWNIPHVLHWKRSSSPMNCSIPVLVRIPRGRVLLVRKPTLRTWRTITGGSFGGIDSAFTKDSLIFLAHLITLLYS